MKGPSMGMTEILFIVGIVGGLLLILSLLGLAFWAIARADARNHPAGTDQPKGDRPGVHGPAPDRGRDQDQ